MLYRLELSKRSRRQLRSLPRQVQLRVARALESLREAARPAGVRKLAGHPDLYRIRVGDYRIIYTIEDERLLVLVLEVGHRREVYERYL